MPPKKRKTAASRLGVKRKKAVTPGNVKGGSKRLKSVRSSVSKAKTKVGDFKRRMSRAKRKSDKNRLERSMKREEKRLKRLEREAKALDAKIKTKAKKDTLNAAREKKILHKLGGLKREQKKWTKRFKAIGL